MDVVRAYLTLGLRVGRHVDGLVDAYYGPPELADEVAHEELRAPGELVQAAEALGAALDDAELDEQRRRWLHAQTTGLETVARLLAGASISYRDEVERCYGVRPEWRPEEELERGHRALDELLPGDGPLNERYQAWREAGALDRETLERVVPPLVTELRERTRAEVGLPDGETVEFDYVTAEPWSAYNYYLGGLRSRVAVNVELPVPKNFVVQLVGHETYPGHHVEHATKEEELVRRRGYLESAIQLVGTPEALVSEGIAEVGNEVVLGGDGLDALAAEHLAAAGVDYDAERVRAVRRAAEPLEGVSTNAALLLHEAGASQQEAKAYFMKWALSSEPRAERSLRFITHPIWRSYVSTYVDGQRLCRAFVAADRARFGRLLREQLTPADLVSSPAA